MLDSYTLIVSQFLNQQSNAGKKPGTQKQTLHSNYLNVNHYVFNSEYSRLSFSISNTYIRRKLATFKFTTICTRRIYSQLKHNAFFAIDKIYRHESWNFFPSMGFHSQKQSTQKPPLFTSSVCIATNTRNDIIKKMYRNVFAHKMYRKLLRKKSSGIKQLAI